MKVMRRYVTTNICNISVVQRSMLLCVMLVGAVFFNLGPALAESPKLPDNLQWISNNNAPKFGDSNAKQGGTYRVNISSFPLTLRTVGPDSNGGFASWLRDNDMALIGMHPNTRERIPELATEWAFDDDNKTMYFKLDHQAQWSDGAPVTTDDFKFLFEMMTSDNLHAPWYKNYFTTKVAGITVYDKYTFAVHAAEEHNRDELISYVNLSPKPKHFYKGVIPEDYVRRYNWKPEPTTGSYHVGLVKKGKFVTLEKTKDWWGYGNPYFKHRYNVDRIQLTVIRDTDISLKHFFKGDIDAYPMLIPSLWHGKAKGKLYDNGYIHKSWLFNNAPEGARGIWMNMQYPLLQDINVRRGIAHSFNIQKMIDQVLQGDYLRMESFGSGHGRYDNPNVKAPRYNIQQAVDYFTEAGFKTIGPDGVRVNEKGERLSVELTYLTKLHTSRAIVLKEEARKTGLEIELKLIEGATGFKALLEKNFQLTLLDMSTSLIPAYWEYFYSTNVKPQTNNFTGYADPEMDVLIDAYDTEFDIDKKAAISHKIQQKISESFCVIPTYSVPFSRISHWRWFRLPEGLGTSLSDSISTSYGLYWIDEDIKKETKEAMKKGKKFEPVTTIDKRFLKSESK